MEHAACRGSEPDLFFSKRYEDMAMEICTRCSVRLECDDLATRMGEAIGIWGGRSQEDRLLQIATIEIRSQ